MWIRNADRKSENVEPTGLGDEKKSINLPTVNGMLIDTAEEINKRPIAMRRGFRSGLAKAIILRKEETLEEESEKSLEGSNRQLRFGGVGDRDTGLAAGDDVSVELSLRVDTPTHGRPWLLV